MQKICVEIAKLFRKKFWSDAYVYFERRGRFYKVFFQEGETASSVREILSELKGYFVRGRVTKGRTAPRFFSRFRSKIGFKIGSRFIRVLCAFHPSFWGVYGRRECPELVLVGTCYDCIGFVDFYFSMRVIPCG